MSGHKGRTLWEMMEEQLDIFLDRLMVDGEEDAEAVAETRGKAQGIAYCLSLRLDPYASGREARGAAIEAVKAEAMERWEEANPDAT